MLLVHLGSRAETIVYRGSLQFIGDRDPGDDSGRLICCLR